MRICSFSDSEEQVGQVTMSLECLEAPNSKNAQRTAVNSLLRFLASENVSIEYVKACIKRGDGGKSFTVLMDQFGYHLAFSAGKNGKTLARNTVMSYFRQAKTWLFKEFSPNEVASIDPPLRKMATTLEKHCLKRESGGFIKKATACTKSDLLLLNRYLYANATTAASYQDAALLCLLWHVFGRASDLTLVQKQNLSASANNVIFLRLVRMKTSEEQGLTLFPDKNLATCPIHAIALALLMQLAPSTRLLDQLPLPATQHPTEAGSPIPLAELLEHSGATARSAATDARPTKAENALGIHTYVNRLLARIGVAAGVANDLSSHSFRRGGAQHANGDAQLSAQWIFDRGAWNLSTTNKAFAYVFNTTAEDQKVARVLSGWDSNDSVQITNLAGFDATTQIKIAAVQARAFSSCSKLQTTAFNTSDQVLGVLLAHLIQHYPAMKKLDPAGLAVARLEECVASARCSSAELLSWSSALQAAATCAHEKQAQDSSKHADALGGSRSNLEKHQAAVIEQLLAVNRTLAE